MQRLHVDCRRLGRARAGAENLRSPAFELRLPRRHLVRMDVELIRDLRDRPLALDRRNRHFGLERRRVVPPRSSAHHSLLIRRHYRARHQADDPPTLPSEIVEPLLPIVGPTNDVVLIKEDRIVLPGVQRHVAEPASPKPHLSIAWGLALQYTNDTKGSLH